MVRSNISMAKTEGSEPPRIGMFGGTFNPVHVGHLLFAETAREQLKLDRVCFIPTGQPPHKSAKDVLPGVVRVQMLQLAIQDNPAFVVSDIELQRKGPSYTIDTLRVIKAQVPAAKLFLLIGQDMLAVRWLAWSEMKRLCQVVVVHRPGCRVRSRQPRLTQLAMPQVDISSSDIRARLKAGRSIRYLVPAAVERYIRQRQLYVRPRESVSP